MGDTIRLWEIKDGSKEAAEVEAGKYLESEERLEDLLAANPEMLMPGLWLVGRQTPIGGGFLDLLGVDADGQLVVFELKRGTLTRDAVAQVIDYGSALEAMSDDELATLIVEHSGQRGIAKIEDFEDWLIQRGHESGTVQRSVQMMLVGLGVDDPATRMVDFLRSRGVDIALLTYYAYVHNGGLLLARRADEQLASEPSAPPKQRGLSTAKKREALRSKVEKMGIVDFWDEAVAALKPPGTFEVPLSKGISYEGPPLEMEGLYSSTASTSHSIRLVEPDSIRVTFYPVAVDLCMDEFEAQRGLFEQATPPNAPWTARVEQEWYCELDKKRWDGEDGEAIKRLVRAVNDRWFEMLRVSR